MTARRAFRWMVESWRESRVLRPFSLFLAFWMMTAFIMFVLEVGTNRQFTGFFDGLWWSVITFSTTGYGDKVPETFAGKALAVFTIFGGVVAMSFLSGSLASFLVDRTARARRGLMDFRRAKGHLVICGWKDDMAEVLLDILQVSDGLAAEDIIVISNIDADRFEALKEAKTLKSLKFVRGDYFSESALARANVQQAQKVLVLADTLDSDVASEVDSKTVMTVLTVKSMARNVYVCAEILDGKYESYLRHAQCDEILLSRDFSRRILASTSATNGMSHIVYELVSQTAGRSRLTTRAIPEEFAGKTFGDYRSAFGDPAKRIIIGVLENTGSPNTMKLESLREAQKTSDVSQLISNLQKVKVLEANRPVLLPDDDYRLERHCQAIVLERV